MWKTTLEQIQARYPCAAGWRKLLIGLNKGCADRVPLPMLRILEINGIYDAIWALRAVNGYDREKRLFACDCADLMLGTLSENEKESIDFEALQRIVDASRRFANGELSAEQMKIVNLEAHAWVLKLQDADYPILSAARAARGTIMTTASGACMYVRTQVPYTYKNERKKIEQLFVKMITS